MAPLDDVDDDGAADIDPDDEGEENSSLQRKGNKGHVDGLMDSPPLDPLAYP